METVGVIGLGIMGGPMAKNLVAGGFTVYGFDVAEKACQQAAANGVQLVHQASDLGAQTQWIITMLPTAQIVNDSLFGAAGVAASLQPGSTVIDESSITPTESRAIAQKLAKQQVRFLDAPVSGGETGAQAGNLAIMVGGEESVFKEALPLLQTVGGEVTRVGDTGAGTTAKLANQVMVNLNIAAMSEALVLASKAGIDIDKMYHAIRSGLAGSSVLDAKVPLILDRQFKPGGSIKINMKDLTNVMKTAHDLDVPMPLSSALLEIFHSLKAQGHLNEDHGAIVKYFEQIAGVTVQRGQ